MKENKPNKHRPSHFYSSEYIYFITSGTYQKKKLFNTNAKKKLFLDVYNELILQYHFKPHAFVLLDNHYHLVIEIPEAKTLKEFFRKLHSKTAVFLNKYENEPGRKIWYQYWDTCIRSDEEYFNNLNYIYWNPVKHGYVNDAKKYPYLKVKCSLDDFDMTGVEINTDFDNF